MRRSGRRRGPGQPFGRRPRQIFAAVVPSSSRTTTTAADSASDSAAFSSSGGGLSSPAALGDGDDLFLLGGRRTMLSTYGRRRFCAWCLSSDTSSSRVARVCTVVVVGG